MDYPIEHIISAMRSRGSPPNDDGLSLAAADTIERLQKEIELLKKENRKAWLGRQSVINDRQKARKERDAALAEVERLKRENNDFREERDLAMSELEPLVEQNQKLQAKLSVIPIATGAPRCTLCGVILDGALHKQFCSTCCAR